MDPVTFAQARLDEDEAAAKAATAYGANWRLADPDRSSAIESDRDSIDRIVVYDEGAPTIEQATHIARHDPARVLREVEAGRRILARHTECAERGTGPCWEFPIGAGVMCRELADLLYRWADHPDYEPAWKPEP